MISHIQLADTFSLFAVFLRVEKNIMGKWFLLLLLLSLRATKAAALLHLFFVFSWLIKIK